jgi:hypothetical protein
MMDALIFEIELWSSLDCNQGGFNTSHYGHHGPTLVRKGVKA